MLLSFFCYQCNDSTVHPDLVVICFDFLTSSAEETTCLILSRNHSISETFVIVIDMHENNKCEALSLKRVHV